MKSRKKALPGIFLVLSIWLTFSLLHANIADSTEKVYYTHITVQPGDTIWQIAVKNAGAKKDIRSLVYEIREINNLQSVHLVPGQKIKVPHD